MSSFDPAGSEFLRISEHYRRMSDEELFVLIPQSSELTPFAQQALANEVRSRGLKAEVADEKPSGHSQRNASQSRAPQFDASLANVSPIKPPPAFIEHASPESDDSAGPDFLGRNSSYDEDRTLVDLCNVYSERDALKLQRILDEQGIPFFVGPEKATSVDRVTSNFADGLAVQIMKIGMPWAMPAMQHFEPEDDPNPKQTEEELDEVMVRCPKCHSEEVVFDGRTAALANAKDESSQKFEWSCDSCGHHWVDDGVAEE